MKQDELGKLVMRNLLLGGAFLLSAIGAAAAAPITVNPGPLFASGNVKAVLAFSEASDMSQLLRVSFAGVIFNNQTDAAGTTKSLGPNFGLIEFQLQNMTMGYTFTNDIADTGPGGDGYYHAKYGTTASDFGVTFSSATNSAIAAIGGVVQLVAFEDRRGGDYDYNDLIFAFSAVQAATVVPEPASIALLGLSLFGVGMLRRRV